MAVRCVFATGGHSKIKRELTQRPRAFLAHVNPGIRIVFSRIFQCLSSSLDDL